MLQHRTVVRAIARALGAAALVGLAVLTLSEAQAQPYPLQRTLCAPGSPFNLRPPIWARFNPAVGGFPMIRKTLDVVAHPEALCNDGSPGVLYLRPSNFANPADPWGTKWLIFFDGGGACREADDCLLSRWCSGSPEIFERAGKMSSRGAFAAIRSPDGIWNPAPPVPFVNHFADYNVVLVHYCSSDNWIGSAAVKTLTTTVPPLQNYDIQFRGEAIVNAVIDTLLAGTTTPDPSPVQAAFNYRLPDLHDATEIDIGAESAGANGMRHHIDRLRDWLEPETGAIVRAIFDASFTPAESDPAIDWSDPLSPVDYVDYLLTSLEPTDRTFWEADDSAFDQTCLGPTYEVDHNLIGIHPQICYDTNYLQLNHITTPIFQRMDVDDPLGKERYLTWNLFPAVDEYWLAAHDQLGLFATYSALGGGLEAPTSFPGIQAPNCQKHVAIQTNAGFFRDLVSGPTYAVPLSFHDLLVNWLNGLPTGDDTVQIQEDNLGAGAYSASTCF